MSKKPELKLAPPKPDLTYELEGAPAKLFVIRRLPSRTWWGPDRAGYFAELARAGTYTDEQLKGCSLRAGEDEVVDLAEAVREYAQERFARANPVVLQAIAATVGR